MDDAALVLAARSGDSDALATIYDRYGDRLHDYCWSILRDRDEAADAFHDAFCIAAQRLGQLREPAKLRPWLYAIARHEALRRATARRRQQPTEELDDVISFDADPGRPAEQEEAAKLVWAAAGGLAERDRALLDLHLRHGLEGQELADAVGVEPGHAYVLLNRLRAQVERSLGALLIARYGRADCTELAKILEGWDGSFSPLLRKRVARHADQCEVCEGRRRTLASPLALLSTVPLLAAPAQLRQRVIDDARLIAHAGGHPPGRAWIASKGGFPPPLYSSRPTRRVAAAAAAGVAVVLAVLALLVLDPFDDDDDEDLSVAAVQPTITTTTVTSTTSVMTRPTTTAAGGPSTSTAPSPSTTATTAAPPPPGPVGARLRLGATRLDFGASSTEQALVLTNDGDAGLTWSASPSSPAFSSIPASGALEPGATSRVAVRLDRSDASEGPLEASLHVTSEGGEGTVALLASILNPPVVRVTIDERRLARSPCSTDPTAASVRADVTDESGIASAVLHWRDPSGGTGARTLAPDGARTYTGRLGPFTTTGTITWWVVATDTLGAVGQSAEQTTPVAACL